MGTNGPKAIAAPAWVMSFALCMGVHGSTTLDLNFVDTDGQPIRLASAELLLVAWGATDRIVLETSADGLSLTLDADWLRSRWNRFDDQVGIYLYLQAPPLAAVQSHRFRWLGAGEHAGAVTIAFPRGNEVTVEEGMKASRTVVFRTNLTASHLRVACAVGLIGGRLADGPDIPRSGCRSESPQR